MERSTRKYGLVNLLVLFVVGVAAFAFSSVTNSLAGEVSIVFLGIGTLVAAVSWFQMRLEENERLEKLEFDELARSKGSSTLFETKDTEGFPAQRSREQFERFFVPVFTGLLMLVEAVSALLLWRWLSKLLAVPALNPSTTVMVSFAVFCVVLFLFGKFSATIARLENHRLLRPSANWVLLGCYICGLVALGAVGVWFGNLKYDLYVAKLLCILLGLVALETLVALILEIYRPRLKGKISRPLYDSRLVGLLGQPEGIFTTASQAIDYQFGFKVSETWFFQYLRNWLGWLILLEVAILLLSTCLVFVEPGEQALVEHFGKPTGTVLNPGGHRKWPWPIDKVYRYRTQEVQSFIVGSQPDPALANQTTVLWTVPHATEEDFLVANLDQYLLSTNDVTASATPEVSLLAVSIPVQFQITNVLDWAYTNENATSVLQSLATREVVRYLAGADLNQIMSKERITAADELRARIQSTADEHSLGAKILFVGLQDIHPPTKVASDYEKVVGANQSELAAILDAKASQIQTNALARASATNIVDLADAYRTRTAIQAYAKAAKFTNQIPAYDAAPSVYLERAKMQMFARATAGARKYVLLTTNHQVLQYDLQDKIREDILQDLTVTPPKR